MQKGQLIDNAKQYETFFRSHEFKVSFINIGICQIYPMRKWKENVKDVTFFY